MSAAIDLYRRSLRESEMRAAVVEAVERQGGRCLWLPDSRGTAFGDWPDLTILLPARGVLMLAELKSQKRVITPGQADMLAMLAQCDAVTACVVRPEPKGNEWSYDELMEWLGAA